MDNLLSVLGNRRKDRIKNERVKRSCGVKSRKVDR